MSNPWTPPGQPPRQVQQPRQAQRPPQPPMPAPGTTPLGAQPPRPVSIDSYGPPSSNVTPAIVLIVAVLSLAAGIFGYRMVSTANPTSSPSPTRSAEPSSTRSGGVSFESRSDNATGHWWVTSSRWEGNKLLVSVTLIADEGQIKPSFYVFGNSDSTVYDPELDAPAPAFGEPRVTRGQTASGNIVFLMKRGPATLVLTDSNGRQISALPIQG